MSSNSAIYDTEEVASNPGPGFEVVVNELNQVNEYAMNSVKTWTITTDTTPTKAEMAEGYLHKLSGSPAADFDFNVVASSPRHFSVRNLTGKTATVQVVGGGGLGVTVPNGTTAALHSDGMDVRIFSGLPVTVLIQVPVTGPADAALTTGDGKQYLPIDLLLNGYTFAGIAARVSTVSGSGAVNIMIRRNRGGVDQDLLSTALTIDVSEKSSTTAATPAVINGTYDETATDDEYWIDIDGAGTGAKGLVVSFLFLAP